MFRHSWMAIALLMSPFSALAEEDSAESTEPAAEEPAAEEPAAEEPAPAAEELAAEEPAAEEAAPAAEPAPAAEEPAPAAEEPAAVAPAPAAEPAPTAEDSGYRDVDLVDKGRTKMEDKRDYENLVTMDMSFLPSTLKVRYTRLLNDNISVMVGGGYGSSSSTGGLLGDHKVSRTVVMAGADFHPIGNGLHGFYVGSRLKHTAWHAEAPTEVDPDPDVEGDETTGTATWDSSKIQIKALIGYRFIIDPGLSVAMGLGPKYTNRVTEAGDDGALGTFKGGKEGMGVGFEFLLGWAF